MSATRGASRTLRVVTFNSRSSSGNTPQRTVTTLRHVGLDRVFPIACNGKPIRLQPGGEGRHLLDLRMHLRTFGDFCMHRAMWLGPCSPYLILPHVATTYVLLHPAAATRQVRQVLLGMATTEIALPFSDDAAANSDIPTIPVEVALAVRDPLDIELPESDEEAVLMAANASAALGLPPLAPQPPGTVFSGSDPSTSGRCHPSFWKVVPELLKAYESNGASNANFRRTYANFVEAEEGGAFDLHAEGDHLVFIPLKRFASNSEVLMHHGRETMVHRLAAMAFSTPVHIDKLRWIEAILRDPRDISTPFPALEPFVEAQTVSNKRILGNLVTRKKATNAAALAFATRLSVVDPTFWVRLVTHAAKGKLPKFDLDASDPDEVARTASALLDAEFTMKDLRRLTLLHLLTHHNQQRQ